MKVFVTGGAGYIGSICVEELLNAGHKVTVFDNLSEGHRAAVDKRAQFIEGDLADRPVLFKTLEQVRPEAVMHFAANALVPESMTNPSKYFRNNVGNGINLLEACIQGGVQKFVFSSTCAIFGVPKKVPISEDLPKEPVNPYGESKLMFEKILHWYERQHGLQYVCLRYFNAAGASDDASLGENWDFSENLVPHVMKAVLGRSAGLKVFGNDWPTPDGTGVRDYIHVEDLASAHVAALDLLDGGGDSVTLNVGTGQGTSVLEIIAATERVTGKAVPREIVGRRAGDVSEVWADASRIRELTGWEPTRTLDDIIATAYAWHSANPDGHPSGR